MSPTTPPLWFLGANEDNPRGGKWRWKQLSSAYISLRPFNNLFRRSFSSSAVKCKSDEAVFSEWRCISPSSFVFAEFVDTVGVGVGEGWESERQFLRSKSHNDCLVGVSVKPLITIVLRRKTWSLLMQGRIFQCFVRHPRSQEMIFSRRQRLQCVYSIAVYSIIMRLTRSSSSISQQTL